MLVAAGVGRDIHAMSHPWAYEFVLAILSECDSRSTGVFTFARNDEIKQDGFCVEEFNTNQVQTERKEVEKQDLLTSSKTFD